MEELKFITHQLPHYLLEDLKKHRALHGVVRGLIQVAFEHGGYIAGGFGTILARHYLLNPDEDGDDFNHRVRRHVGYPQKKSTSESAYRNAGAGDIDIWFPNKESLDGFQCDDRLPDVIREYSIEVSPTMSGAAIEYLVEGEGRIQVVSKYLQPMEEQLRNFDIYNGAVGFTDTVCMAPEHWALLESNNMIHVTTWESPWTINRFIKWVGRKGYTSASPATASHVLERVQQALDWKKKWSAIPTIRYDERISQAIKDDKLMNRFINEDAYQAQEFLKVLMPTLTGEQLLEVSAMFPAPITYDFAMQEIRRRMPRQ